MSVPYRLVRPRRRVVAPPVLDPAQAQVVAHSGGPLMVLAGPGTGKTTTLVEAVAERIRVRGVAAEQILVLTFGARAAGELRDRITARLDMTTREPVARTFHSYAFGLLRMASDADLPAPRLLSGAEQDVMLRALIEGDVADGRASWPSELVPALTTRGFAAELRDLLLRAGERGVDPVRLDELGRQLGRADWRSAARFWQQYLDVTVRDRPGAFDAAELIGAAIAALEHDPDLLARERARRRHIFVDEYQDTDPAQAQLLSLLADGAEELVIVGDPDQSIYAFRGADPDAMRRADDVFPAERFAGYAERHGQLFAMAASEPMPTMALTTSRRSGPTLLAATRRIAAALPGPVAHRQLSAVEATPPGEVTVSLYRSATEEAAAIATRLRRAHLDAAVPWAGMAVIVRSTAASLAVLRRAMITAGVPVTVAGADQPLAEQNAVSQLLTALGAVVRPSTLTDDVAAELLLGAIGDADALYLRRLRRELFRLAAAAGEPDDAELIVPVLTDPGALATLPPRLHRPLAKVADVLARGRAALADGGKAEDVLWAIWSATGLAQVWERQSREGGASGAAADRDLDAVLDLFDAAARLADRLPQATALALHEHVVAQQLPLEAFSRGRAPGDAVQILTAHASKGLEWDVVCVASVQEGRWPDVRRRGSLLGSERLVDVVAQVDDVSGYSIAPQLAEERRLFYVALTRARRHLHVSAVAGEDEQPSRFLDELDPIDGERPILRPERGLHLSELVAELRAVVTDPTAEAAVREHAARELARLSVAGVAGADPAQWWGIEALSDERGLIDDDVIARVSPSRIEAFDRCALKAFLDGNGAREDDTAKAALGSALHEIAELADASADVDELERMMDDRWAGLDFGAPWYDRVERKRASAMLVRLSTWLSASRRDLSLVARELDFRVVVDEVELAGQVDRLEVDADGRPVVVDFKTSKTPVAAGDLAEHLQLAAYQAATAAGAFAEVVATTEPGGASLVELGTTRKDIEQKQPPLAAAPDPEHIHRVIAAVGALQRGHRFDATVNSLCKMCPAQRVCPAQQGRQVTE
jgi:superfamily I DNA/RNA helicase/RecB family exonuclease